MRYFITFACYGARLHGAEAGSVDLRHNLPGAPLVEPDSMRVTFERNRMRQAPFFLDTESGAAVLEALHEVCASRDWTLFAAHVRTNHVHTAVEASVLREKVMNAFKAYASRRLNRAPPCEIGRKHWARHGSTKWLRNDKDARVAIRCVVEEQGEPMAVFVLPNRL